MKQPFLRALPALLIILVFSARASESQLGQKLDFNRDIRPILSENCFQCHGPDDNKRKAGLRLDKSEHAFKPAKSGAVPIVPGKPDDSEVIKRVLSTDDDEHMPPKRTLTNAQIATLKTWIRQGSEYKPHWAFIPPERPSIPAVSDPHWPHNGIDNFILAKLDQEHLKHSPEADKRTLIRRASLDLIGLPPTTEEVDAFLADNSPDAYEKVVDRLLASPHYGERMAMNWLDGARYADSNGYQADYERYMWPWRDWVLNAFNTNMPFDQFTIEQLAGDLIPNATLEQRLATGFNRNHRINTEGGIIAEEWRIETVIDRVETTSGVWLGLTMGCCRCHDHKYDPITQKEFYGVFSFFNNNNESGSGAEKAVNHPPLIKVASKEQQAKQAQLTASIHDVETRLAVPSPSADAAQREWEVRVSKELPSPPKMDPWQSAGPFPAASYDAAFDTAFEPEKGVDLKASYQDGKIKWKAQPAFEDGKVHNLTNKNSATYLYRVIHAEHDAPLYLSLGSGDAIKAWVNNTEVLKHNIVRKAAADQEKLTISLHAGENTLLLKIASGGGGGHGFYFKMNESGLPPAVSAALKVAVEKRNAAQKDELSKFFRRNVSTEFKPMGEELAKLQMELADLDTQIPTSMVMEELAKPRTAHVLIRGQYDKLGDAVPPVVPAALNPFPKDAPLNRLGFAKWIMDPGNPLTARVAVNRFWEKFFGVGIVKTSENFGSQAEWPSNPDLLDWLATEFVRLKWDMKAIQKTIVMSSAYRQSSRVTPELLEKDPENRLVARGPRFRLQAELIRDQALAISGLLVDQLGGPSVKPYQPDGIWDEFSVYGNLHNYKHDTGSGLYRRSLYTIWKRTAAPPEMTIFDSPSREICVVKRARTNTPLQALALLNDITYVEASRALAERMIKEGGANPGDRIGYAFKRALAREPNADEKSVLEKGLEKRLAIYKAEPESAKKLINEGQTKSDPKLDPAELAAYTLTASVIMNLDEIITKE